MWSAKREIAEPIAHRLIILIRCIRHAKTTKIIKDQFNRHMFHLHIPPTTIFVTQPLDQNQLLFTQRGFHEQLSHKRIHQWQQRNLLRQILHQLGPTSLMNSRLVTVTHQLIVLQIQIILIQALQPGGETTKENETPARPWWTGTEIIWLIFYESYSMTHIHYFIWIKFKLHFWRNVLLW